MHPESQSGDGSDQKAKAIFEHLTRREWEAASEDEARLARWAADSDSRAEQAEARAHSVAEAEQCFR